MKYNKVLITGGSGKLGKILSSSGLKNILLPTRKELDITQEEQVKHYFNKNKIDAIIHCAAMTDMAACEKNPGIALKTNVGGTLNLVNEASKRNVRFLYISTDYVYPGVNGPYKESDPTIPFTVYGWTKLGGECAIRTLKNYCIIRTSFFEPEKINFDTAPKDAFYSRIPIKELGSAILFLLEDNFVGVINVGQKRSSIYEIVRKYKPDVKPVSIEDIEFNRAIDSSLDVSLWKKTFKG